MVLICLFVGVSHTYEETAEHHANAPVEYGRLCLRWELTPLRWQNFFLWCVCVCDATFVLVTRSHGSGYFFNLSCRV